MVRDLHTAIRNYLVTSEIGVVGETLFIDDIPAKDVDNEVITMFRVTGSVDTDQYVPIRKPTVQFLCYGRNKSAVIDKIENVFCLFHQLPSNTQIDPAIDLIKVNTIQEPSFVFVDDEGRVQYTFNAIFYIREM